ncbi:MAG TPA: terminase gpA endonuclease subunit [Candidatus Binatia bacterium]|jgi:hypothetical protein
MIGVDTAKDAIYAKLKVTTPGRGYCHFSIAYQQEFFNQRRGPDALRARPSRALLVQTVGQKERGPRPPCVRARRAARAPGSVGDPLPRRADRTTAAAAITARGRRFSLGPSVITSARAGKAASSAGASDLG